MAETPKQYALPISYRAIFLGALGLTVLSLLMMFVLSIFGENETRKSVIDTLGSIATLGAGAIIGLVGGKVAK